MLRYIRWTRHRLNDGVGNDYHGLTPINLMWVASAAAEETLQGSPLAGAWLNLFSAQLSQNDPLWLRWGGDMAESTELRRAYSGLYGRFFARALLQQHLGFTNFISLGRDGVEVNNSVAVKRTCNGDIPDWIAWCPRRNRHVLGEAKGTLTAKDFLGHAIPKCVVEGKKQFERVSVFDGHTVKTPLKWVAASRWATDLRTVTPVTALFDPPEDDVPYSENEAHRHSEAMHRAWLDSLAAGFGIEGADDFMSDANRDRRMVIIAWPGGDGARG